MSDILKEVRVRGYGQDRDIKVTIEKVGVFNKKRKVYSTFWGSNQARFEEDKPLYEWDPIEFTLKDLTEDNNFGEYQKYYEAYIKERDQPKTGFRAYNNFERNNLEFSNEWNTDLDIIKLYVLINTEKYKEKIYEWSLIEDPIKGEKGGLAPYYRSFGFDAYYLNNGTRVRISWLEGKYTAGGDSWGDSKGRELDNQDLSRYNTSYLEKKTKSYFEKAIDGIWAPDKNPAGDYFMDFDPKGPAPNFVKEPIYGEGRQKWSGLTDDISILNQIVSAWKQAVPGYENLAVLENGHRTPAIEISDSKDKLIEYKSPFGMSASGPSASGPSASDATASGASASGASASGTFTPTFHGIQDGFQITAKTDIPSFSIYVGDPEKWPIPVATPEEIAAGNSDDFENVSDEGLDEEFTELGFAGDEEEIVYQLGSIYGDSEGSEEGNSGSDASTPSETVKPGALPPSSNAGGSGNKRFQKSMMVNGVKVLNGELPKNLVKKVLGFELEVHAAIKLAALNQKFKEKFGHDIKISGGNRSFDVQNKIFDWPYYEKTGKGRKLGTNGGVAAAKPGTSQHGWALAIDCSGLGDKGSPQFDWMDANAPKYGWVNPAWAKKGGAGHEPWHWEYIGGDAYKNDGAK